MHDFLIKLPIKTLVVQLWQAKADVRIIYTGHSSHSHHSWSHLTESWNPTSSQTHSTYSALDRGKLQSTASLKCIFYIMTMHTKGLSGALRRSLNPGQQQTFVRHRGGPTLHRCPLFLEHYIPGPSLQQEEFPKPSCSSDTWSNAAGSGLSELWLSQLQKASNADKWPREHHNPFIEKAQLG